MTKYERKEIAGYLRQHANGREKCLRILRLAEMMETSKRRSPRSLRLCGERKP